MSARTRLALGTAALAALAFTAARPASVQARTLPPSGYQQAVARLPAIQQRVAAGLVPTHVHASATPPAGSISPNVKFLSNLPLPTAISIAFLGDTAFVSTVEGLFSVDISDPTNPQLLGSIPMYIWENEHMQIDAARSLLIVSRDPRGFTSPGTTVFPDGMLQIFDVSNPRAMVEVGTHLQPTGHTATCIDACRYLWVAGPAAPCAPSPLNNACVAAPNGADPSWPGRPVWGVDISDPANPVDCPHFIDLGAHNGSTDYDHDADVDADGIAWVSGSGHIRGYWTAGRHLNAADGKVETATPCDPIQYAGANMVQGLFKDDGDMHNSERNLNIAVDGRRGDVLTATEENTTTDCASAGKLWTYDLQGTRGTQVTGREMYPVLGSWSPYGQPGTSYPTGCDSAHWFNDRGDGLLAMAFYTQGTRILDTRDPRHIKEVGWYNVQNQTGSEPNNAWAAYWHGDNYIYVADFYRGLDILRYTPATPAAEGSGSSPSGGAGPSASSVAAATPNTSPPMPPGAPAAMLAAGMLIGGSISASRRRRRRPA